MAPQALHDLIERFIAAAEDYRCASAPISERWVYKEAAMIEAREALRAALLAPRPEQEKALVSRPVSQEVKPWTLAQLRDNHAHPFEYDQGDLVVCHYDEIHDALQKIAELDLTWAAASEFIRDVVFALGKPEPPPQAVLNLPEIAMQVVGQIEELKAELAAGVVSRPVEPPHDSVAAAPRPGAEQADEHDPLCSEGTWAGDQRMPCDCHLSKISRLAPEEETR